jgi:cytochrome c biogenesis protein CcmG/thiol:disulfide interchange protein DsbE
MATPRKPFVLLPLAAFGALALLLGRGLHSDARELPSALVGHAAPTFTLARVDDPAAQFSPAQLRGQVWVLNVWASWCAPCRAEVPALQALQARNVAPIVGLNYKDPREQSLAWLRSHGNPYAVNVQDAQGRVGIDYGVIGVPETFVIDARGVVRLKHTGPVTPEVVRDTLLPLIEQLKRERSKA